MAKPSLPGNQRDHIQRVAQNARSLRDDANYLLKDNRCRRAFALTVLAIEEVGKIVDTIVIRQGAGKDHQKKQISASSLVLMGAIARAVNSKMSYSKGQITFDGFKPRLKPTAPVSQQQKIWDIMAFIDAHAAEEDAPAWDEVKTLLEIYKPLSQGRYNEMKNAALYEDSKGYDTT